MEGLQFNVAHSDAVTVYAFAFGCALGVDLERIRNMEDLDAIARHFFCSEEVADLETFNPETRRCILCLLDKKRGVYQGDWGGPFGVAGYFQGHFTALRGSVLRAH